MTEASVVSASEAEAAEVHAQMQDKQCSILYACKDTALLPNIEYAVCVVHVASHLETSDQFSSVITHLANLYLGAGDAPLYVLQLISGNLKIFFADNANAPALVERIEQGGLPVFVRAFLQAFSGSHCNMAYLYYDTLADMEQVKHTVILGHNIPLPLTDRAHPQLQSLIDMCQSRYS